MLTFKENDVVIINSHGLIGLLESINKGIATLHMGDDLRINVRTSNISLVDKYQRHSFLLSLHQNI